jgi:hypothetical protein
VLRHAAPVRHAEVLGRVGHPVAEYLEPPPWR